MVRARAGIAQTVRIRRGRRNWQRQRDHRLVEREAVTPNDWSHVVSPAEHDHIAKGARTPEEAQGQSGRSGPRDWPRGTRLASHGLMVPRSRRLPPGTFRPRRKEEVGRKE